MLVEIVNLMLFVERELYEGNMKSIQFQLSEIGKRMPAFFIVTYNLLLINVCVSTDSSV